MQPMARGWECSHHRAKGGRVPDKEREREARGGCPNRERERRGERCLWLQPLDALALTWSMRLLRPFPSEDPSLPSPLSPPVLAPALL